MVCQEMTDWLGARDSWFWDDTVRGVCSTQCMLYSVYAVPSVCCTRCMLYSVYAALGVNIWSWHREIESNDFTWCSQAMVDLRTRKREMRGDRWNHPEKLGLEKILRASQFTIPDTVGMSIDPVCNYTDTSSFQPNEEGCTPDFSYLLVIFTSLSSLSPISLFLIHNSNIISEHKVSLSVSISPCHDHELTPGTASTGYSIPQVQHTPSIAYTEHSIHRVQHTPGTA